MKNKVPESFTDKGMETRRLMMEKIIEYFQDHGYAPSVREIGDMSGLSSSSSVYANLAILTRQGKLQTDAPAGTPRAFRAAGYRFMKEGDE